MPAIQTCGQLDTSDRMDWENDYEAVVGMGVVLCLLYIYLRLGQGVLQLYLNWLIFHYVDPESAFVDFFLIIASLDEMSNVGYCWLRVQ